MSITASSQLQVGSSHNGKCVTVIVPTYNSDETLAKCLESIRRQSYPPYSIIVVDNFSDDLTVEIASKFGAKVIRRWCNPASARNIGARASTSKYVLFVDSDQVLTKSVIEECVERCKSEGVGMLMIPEAFIGRGFWGSCSAAWKSCYVEVCKRYRKSGLMVVNKPRFFVKEYLTQAGMFNDNLLWGEDLDLYMRMKGMGIKEGLCKSKIYHYEPSSLKKMLFSFLRYGKSVWCFQHRAQKQIFRPLFVHALLTLNETFKKYGKSPAVIMGCMLLLWLKACSIAIGLLTAKFGVKWATRNNVKPKTFLRPR